MEIYKVALEHFLREVIWVESKLDQRILCNSSLTKWEPELAYLGISVTDWYREIAGRGT